MTRRANNAVSSPRSRRFDRAFLLLATLCVALMPSTFRGGAEVAHPHGFFQFWISGPERAFDHHASHSNESHAPHHHGLMSTVRGEAGTEGSGEPVIRRDVPISADIPSVSPVEPPGGIVSMLVAVGLIGVTMACPAMRPWRYASWKPFATDRRESPKPRPPRVSLSFNVV